MCQNTETLQDLGTVHVYEYCIFIKYHNHNYTVKPRFTARFEEKEISTVNRGFACLQYVYLSSILGKKLAPINRGLR